MNQIRMVNTQSSDAQIYSKVKIENPSSEADASQTAPQRQSSSSSSSDDEHDDNGAVQKEGATAVTMTKPTHDNIKRFRSSNESFRKMCTCLQDIIIKGNIAGYSLQALFILI
ncbi:MAG: hypothetical protein EZS28_014567 [Streblomastix strix]|uniref:Uncharacterized protein n=1 Tax=Streblomastix strix TaxID=222440 RepID=A0A5J4W5D4_9EUKA|nr:MAG: hypothetical protein EZS28_014567 [Streblomastix strix]